MGNIDDLSGRKLGDYRLLNRLTSGGMAHIYLGEDEKLRRRAAIKILTPDLAGEDETLRERFEREARAVAQLEHDNIIPIYQFGEADNLYFIAMRYIEGNDLAAELKETRQRNQLIKTPRALYILRQVAAALDYAHERGIIHRDVKPSNVLLGANDKAVLTDFGLVLWESMDKTLGTAFGTPRYISPEQATDSQTAVAQSDIYSLAVIIYEILTGELMFQGKTPMEVALSHITEKPIPPRALNPDIPVEVQNELMRALSKEPKDRHATATELVNALSLGYGIQPDPLVSTQTQVELDEGTIAFSPEDLKQADKDTNEQQVFAAWNEPSGTRGSMPSDPQNYTPTKLGTEPEVAAWREASMASASMAQAPPSNDRSGLILALIVIALLLGALAFLIGTQWEQLTGRADEQTAVALANFDNTASAQANLAQAARETAEAQFVRNSSETADALLALEQTETASAPTLTFTQPAMSTATHTLTVTIPATATQVSTNASAVILRATDTATSTLTATATDTATSTLTATATDTATSTLTDTATATDTATNTDTATATATDTATATATDTATNTATSTDTATDTATNTLTATATATDTATNTATSTDTATDTATNTLTATATATATDTATNTLTATATATDTATSTLTATATDTATNTLTATATATNTATNTATSTATHTATATQTQIANPTRRPVSLVIRYNLNFFSITNDSTRFVDLSRLRFVGAAGEVVGSGYPPQLDPGQCFFVRRDGSNVTDNDIPADWECGENARTILTDPIFWRADGPEDHQFTVLDDAMEIRTCDTVGRAVGRVEPMECSFTWVR